MKGTNLMKEFKFKKIDAFATIKSDGNPAGYINLDSRESINENEMQRIARELKGFVNEVGYIYRENETTFSLKYYSSEREVEFCGHATIAIMYDIIKNTGSLINQKEISIITNKGQLVVENQISSKDAVFIMAPNPDFRTSVIQKEEIAAAMNIGISDISDKFEISIVNAGLETLIIPINTLSSILRINPELHTLKNFCIKNGIDIIEVFCNETYDTKCNFRTRVFAPTFGYLEDPATGSGNSAFGYYLLKNSLWNGESLIIEQNGTKDRYNIVQLKTRLDLNGSKRVLFGGGAITRIDGKYILT
ncbi:PhzF family phenazine biosynthesis protein [Dehalobacter sp. DCM]|uniref:PhzF family phenazine biosynthesis protein n=1 Tax=Dehalobacter sp. DCM TaxID=2907827 RepID=UPI003081324E|nr:PhzF family phenazine biosynthesis protein [Dehalobacter sp. DCM]